VDADERREQSGRECASCGVELRDDEHDLPVCRACDRRLDVELAAYLDFVRVCRAE
jgi:hypothetical protein